MLVFVAENASTLTTKYGNVSAATIGTIQRTLLVLENQSADKFLGEPALDIKDLMRTDRDGRGFINILAADTGGDRAAPSARHTVDDGTGCHVLRACIADGSASSARDEGRVTGTACRRPAGL